MKKTLVILSSLLPFLHGTGYEAEVKGCTAEGITLEAEGERFDAELFNIGYADENSWQSACTMLKEAAEVRFEIDPLVSLQEPLPVYLYADETMVQVKLLEEQEAYIAIRNPAYRYETSLELAQDAQSVMADPLTARPDASLPLRSYLIYGLALALWVLLFYVLIVRHHPRFIALRRQKRKSGKKS